MTKQVTKRIASLRNDYHEGVNDLEQIGDIGAEARKALVEKAESMEYDHWADTPEKGRFYDVFRTRKGISRPIRRDLFIADQEEFQSLWKELTSDVPEGVGSLNHDRLGSILYTCQQSVAAFYDLFQPSQKPPGTFFEIMVGSLAAHISGLKRKAQIKLPREGYRVTTDVVIELQEGGPGIVFPCKITTRERIVQVFAHQRLLDSVFGEGTYPSVLTCVSETQLDKKKGKVKEICVPIQVEIFQKYLAKLEGLYYLDPPAVYVEAGFAKPGFRPRLPVKNLATLFSEDLTRIVNQLNTG
ncbi:hypothetical protein ACFL2Q_05405 [Thermodesulfobacteriota bacterium]